MVRGLWAKLAYVARLRDQKGEYQHWGLMRCHGSDQARSAMREVHEQVYAELLRSPFPRSLEELNLSAAWMRQSNRDYIERFDVIDTGYIPASMVKRTQRHFRALVEGLQTLLRASQHRGA